MKKVKLYGSSVLGQVLIHVLSRDDILPLGPEKKRNSPDLYVFDLDHLVENNKELNYDGRTPVIGLTFSHPDRARVNPRLISFDCPALRIIQKPFRLSCLRQVILKSPDGFEPAYGCAGINLYSLLKKCQSSKTVDPIKDCVRKAVFSLYPRLFEVYRGEMDQCLNVLPLFILSSFYENLAHGGSQYGLEGRLGILAGAAIDYFIDKASFYAIAKEFLVIVQEEIRNLSLRKKDLNHLLNLLEDDDHKETVVGFLEKHEKIENDLKLLEKSVKETVDGKGESKCIADMACQIGIDLRELLDRREDVKNRMRKNP